MGKEDGTASAEPRHREACRATRRNKKSERRKPRSNSIVAPDRFAHLLMTTLRIRIKFIVSTFALSLLFQLLFNDLPNLFVACACFTSALYRLIAGISKFRACTNARRKLAGAGREDISPRVE